METEAVVEYFTGRHSLYWLVDFAVDDLSGNMMVYIHHLYSEEGKEHYQGGFYMLKPPIEEPLFIDMSSLAGGAAVTLDVDDPRYKMIVWDNDLRLFIVGIYCDANPEQLVAVDIYGGVTCVPYDPADIEN